MVRLQKGRISLSYFAKTPSPYPQYASVVFACIPRTALLFLGAQLQNHFQYHITSTVYEFLHCIEYFMILASTYSPALAKLSFLLRWHILVVLVVQQVLHLDQVRYALLHPQ